MTPPRHSALVLAGLATLAFSLACLNEARTLARTVDPKPFSLLETVLGESRRLFANHFFIKADAYFHSGYYPTVFDNQEGYETAHIAADAGAAEEKNSGEELGFLGQPLDPFEAFSRRFFPSEHTHLDEGGADHESHDKGGSPGVGGDVREMLPWLKIAANLDPNRVETYTVTAFWLRDRLHRSQDAEDVIHDGLRNNPGDASLLFELGRIFFHDRKDFDRARNVFEAGINSWNKNESGTKEPNKFLALQLLSQLAELEEETGHYERSIHLWEQAKVFNPASPGPQIHIADLRAKLASPTTRPQ